MSRNSGNRAIAFFNRADEQPAKAMQAQTGFIHASRATGEAASELPTEEDPGIGQDETDAQQEETQGRVARGSGSANTAQQAVAAFDAKATTILLVDFVWRPVKQDHDKGQPLATELACFVGNQGSLHGNGCLGTISK